MTDIAWAARLTSAVEVVEVAVTRQQHRERAGRY